MQALLKPCSSHTTSLASVYLACVFAGAGRTVLRHQKGITLTEGQSITRDMKLPQTTSKGATQKTNVRYVLVYYVQLRPAPRLRPASNVVFVYYVQLRPAPRGRFWTTNLPPRQRLLSSGPMSKTQRRPAPELSRRKPA
jgi:hypothetical protein